MGNPANPTIDKFGRPLVVSDYQSGTQARAIRFADTNLPPPSPLYVTGDEALIFNVYNSVPGATFRVSYRQLFPDGTMSHSEQVFQITSNRVNNQIFIGLQEGFLINLHVNASGASVRRGQMFCTAGIVLSPLGTGAYVATLFSDYLDNTTAMGWPAGMVRQSIEGPGILLSVANAAPAAGADFTVTVPNGARWRVRSLTFTFTTAVAAATRTVELVVTDATPAALYRMAATTTQIASLGNRYTAADMPFAVATDAAQVQVPLPPDLMLMQGWKITSSTTNIQAADQYSVQQLLVEEWIEP